MPGEKYLKVVHMMGAESRQFTQWGKWDKADMASVEFKIIKKLPDNGAVDRLYLTHLIIITINKKKNP